MSVSSHVVDGEVDGEVLDEMAGGVDVRAESLTKSPATKMLKENRRRRGRKSLCLPMASSSYAEGNVCVRANAKCGCVCLFEGGGASLL